MGFAISLILQVPAKKRFCAKVQVLPYCAWLAGLPACPLDKITLPGFEALIATEVIDFKRKQHVAMHDIQ